MTNSTKIENLFLKGNAVEDGKRGWFVGQFVPEIEGLRHQGDVELKWGIHPAGERRGSWAYYNKATSIPILIEGRFQLWVRGDGMREECFLEKPGDYVIINPGLRHDWAAVSDSVVLTVRFPSIAGDQFEESAVSDFSP
jgi:mannose-6-phosphate isomerase-like protein (cupin superfamily)